LKNENPDTNIRQTASETGEAMCIFRARDSIYSKMYRKVMDFHFFW
jgi:hypothetical protein